MAAGFQVAGPCQLKVGGSVVGYTTDDDMISVEYAIRNRILKATDTGDEPAEMVYLGTVCVLSATLVKWDETVAATLFVPPGGSAEGDAGTIGALWVGGSHTFATDIIPTTAGKKAYHFARCFLDGENAIRQFDYGNDGKKLGVQIIAMRDGSDNIYTTTTTS